MSDVLSQAEVERLLSAMDTAKSGVAEAMAPAASAGAAAAPVGPAGPPPPREKVTPYDFKRPERVGKEQMRALQTMHEGFGRNLGAALSALLRTIVEVKLTSVDQLTYSEFVFSLENPTCFNLINAKPLEGQLILDINPSLLFPIIDRLLGGAAGSSSSSARRPLTEIELRLVSRITDLFLSEMTSAWENVLPLELEVDSVESNAQLVQIVPPNEVVVLISFELTLGETRGMINLCIPFNAIERIGGKLSANSWVSYSKRPSTPDSVQQLGDQLGDSVVEVVAELAQTKLATRDLINLRIGDIIATEKDIEQPLVLEVEGKRKFYASAGAFKGRKALRIAEPIEEEHIDVGQPDAAAS
ncbi:MAG: flagellar motor switch protein FliM [Planctomycetota bacterium]